MTKVTKLLATGAVGLTMFLLAPGLGHAQSTNYCYSHPYDNSHFCFCYHHPKECNEGYRHRYPDWNRPPDWRAHPDVYRHDHPGWYGNADSDRVFANADGHGDHGNMNHDNYGHPGADAHPAAGQPNHGHNGHPNDQH
jgi:hypothetical protein